jgi:uncharacterized protein YidB (DUF937 family)
MEHETMSGFFGAALGQLSGMFASEHAAAGEGLVSTALASSGGMSGLFEKMQQAGLGDKLSSWVSGGPNASISADDITKIFPPEQIEAFAEQHGVPADVATGLLAHLLPHAVDNATPDGAAPADTDATT